MALAYPIGAQFYKISPTGQRTGTIITVVNLYTSSRGVQYLVTSSRHNPAKPYPKEAHFLEDTSRYEPIIAPAGTYIGGGSGSGIAGPGLTLKNKPVHPSDFMGMAEFDDKEMAESEPPKKVTNCDCGAHKCGYEDHETHAHSHWCKVQTWIAPVPKTVKQ